MKEGKNEGGREGRKIRGREGEESELKTTK